MQKTITFDAGLRNTPYNDTCQDGELAKAEGVEVYNGSLRPAVLEGVKTTMPGGCQLVYRHVTGEYIHWIVQCGVGQNLLWILADEQGNIIAKTGHEDDPGQTTLGWKTKFATEMSIEWEEGMSVVGLGNILTIMAPEKKMRYVYWKGGEYRVLGEVPKIYLSFSTSSQYSDALRIDLDKEAIKMVYAEADLDLYSADDEDSDTFSLLYPDQNDNATRATISRAWAEMLSKAAEHNTFVLPYFVRYAIRSYDNTIIWASAPVLMQPTVAAPLAWHHVTRYQDLKNGDASVDAENEKEWMCFMLGSNDQSLFDSSVTVPSEQATNLKIKLEGTNPSNIDLSKWRDVIKSIDIYVSEPITLFDVDNGYWRTTKRPDLIINAQSTEYGSYTHGDWLLDQWTNCINNFQFRRTYGDDKDSIVNPIGTQTLGENNFWKESERLYSYTYLDKPYRCDNMHLKQKEGVSTPYFTANQSYDSNNKGDHACKFPAELEWIYRISNDTDGYKKEGGEWKEGSQDEIARKLYFGIRFMNFIKPNGLPRERVKEKIEIALENMRLLKSFTITEMTGTDGKVSFSKMVGLVTVTQGYLSNLSTKEALKSIAGSGRSLCGGKALNYNQRLHVFDAGEIRENEGRMASMIQSCGEKYDCKIKTTFWHDKDVITHRTIFHYKDNHDGAGKLDQYDILPLTSTSDNNLEIDSKTKSSVGVNIKAYVKIVDGDVISWVKLSEAAGFFLDNEPDFFCYPSALAESIVVCYSGSTSRMYEYTLTKDELSDLAYWSVYTDTRPSALTMTQTELDQIENQTGVSITKRSNYIFSSAVENPLSFGNEGVNRVGSGTIKALAVQKVEMSPGQFGDSQMVVMSTDGNYAMSVSASKQQTGVEEGLLYGSTPMASELLKGDNVAMTEGALLYVCDGGVAMLAGNQSERLSDVLSGVGGFGQWVSGAQVLYDYSGQRVLIVRKDSDLCYIMSNREKAWTVMHLPGKLIGVVNEFPAPIVQVKVDSNTVVYSLNSVYRYTRDGVHAATLETRPLKLDSQKMKKLDELAVVGDITGQMKVALMGSNDLRQWHMVGSSMSKRVPHVGGRYFKYWKLRIDMRLQKDEDLTGITIRWTERADADRLR